MISSSRSGKRFLANHWNVCKPFLLLSGWAALIAYSLMLVCLYSYPISVAELVTVFIKLFLLSSSVVFGAYVLFAMAKTAGIKLIVWIRAINIAKAKRRSLPIPDSFAILSTESYSVSVEPVLCYEENSAPALFS